MFRTKTSIAAIFIAFLVTLTGCAAQNEEPVETGGGEVTGDAGVQSAFSSTFGSEDVTYMIEGTSTQNDDGTYELAFTLTIESDEYLEAGGPPRLSSDELFENEFKRVDVSMEIPPGENKITITAKTLCENKLETIYLLTPTLLQFSEEPVSLDTVPNADISYEKDSNSGRTVVNMSFEKVSLPVVPRQMTLIIGDTEIQAGSIGTRFDNMGNIVSSQFAFSLPEGMEVLEDGYKLRIDSTMTQVGCTFWEIDLTGENNAAVQKDKPAPAAAEPVAQSEITKEVVEKITAIVGDGEPISMRLKAGEYEKTIEIDYKKYAGKFPEVANYFAWEFADTQTAPVGSEYELTVYSDDVNSYFTVWSNSQNVLFSENGNETWYRFPEDEGDMLTFYKEIRLGFDINEFEDLRIETDLDNADFDTLKEPIIAAYIEHIKNLSPGNTYGASEWIPLEYGGGMSQGSDTQKPSISISVNFAGKPASDTELLEWYWDFGAQREAGTGEYEGYIMKGITLYFSLEENVWAFNDWFNYSAYIY